jgi:hypothetical protein
MRGQSPASTASFGVNQEPPHTDTLGNARYCGAVSGVTPPVGQKRTSGNGPCNAFSSAIPPAALAGKKIPTPEDRYRADVAGDIENVNGVL